MTRPKILLLAEDRVLTESLTSRLQQEGFDTNVIRDGREGLQRAEEFHPALILFGLDKSAAYAEKFCRAIRRGKKTHEIPVLLLANHVHEIEQRPPLPEGVVVIASRPFEIEAVMPQVRALSQRRVWGRTDADVVEHLGICTDRIRHQASVNGTMVHLTLTEFRLLDCFLRQPGRAFTRTLLVQAAIGGDTLVLERTIDVHIKALRRKLGQAGEMIETVRGVGYRLREALLT